MPRSRMARMVLAGIVVSTCACGTVTSGTSTTAPTTTLAPTTGSSATTSSTTTTTTPPDGCAVAPVLEIADGVIAAARLSPPSVWIEDFTGSGFVDAVVEPEPFASGLALNCSLRRVSRPGEDDERLVLAAWTGDRRALVVLAADTPGIPYDQAVRVDLLFEAPWGEWVTDDVWAVGVSTGESIILHTHDYPLGPVAKSFLVAFPEPPGPPIETDTEAYAIDVLTRAGGRNVGVAEPTQGSPVAPIAFMSPLGNPMIATVGPVDVFDAFDTYLTGARTSAEIAGVTLVVASPGPDQYGVAEVAFTCGPWGWRLESSFGTPAEAIEFAGAIITAGECAT